eukprot:gene9751-20277_t
MFVAKIISHVPIFRARRRLCIQVHMNPNASAPLSQAYRNTWPDPKSRPTYAETTLPKRTIPDSVLRFKLTSTSEHGNAIYYPHLKFHPADCKVSLDDLGLSTKELPIFLEMVGTRFNPGKREVRLIGDRFPNRIENKRYLVYLLENLLAETRRLSSFSEQFV